MELKNKIILIAYSVLCGMFILIVPWWHPYKGDIGYSFIVQPPMPTATIRVEGIIENLIIITIIAAIAFFLAKKFVK